MEYLGEGAFYKCVALTEMRVPGSIETVNSHAFALYSGLRKITVEPGVKIIGDSAFFLCTGLTRVVLPEGVTALENHAFRECTGLREIWLPASVTSLGEMAFYQCGSLTDIYFGGAKAQWEAAAIDDRALPENVTLHFDASPPCAGGEACPGNGVSDMPAPENWAHKDIDFCVETGLMNGIGGVTHLAPNASATREQIAPSSCAICRQTHNNQSSALPSRDAGRAVFLFAAMDVDQGVRWFLRFSGRHYHCLSLWERCRRSRQRGAIDAVPMSLSLRFPLSQLR